jgi:TRAP-type C4-dicarboxylate transport system permease small subunit
MSVISKIGKLADVFASAGFWVASILVFVMEGLFLVEIIGRTYFDWSTFIEDEYSAYFLLGLVFMGLAYGFKTEAHISISIVTSNLSPRNRHLMDLLGSLICIGFFIYFAFFAWDLVAMSYEVGERSNSIMRTPVFIPESALFIGCLLVIIQLVKRIINVTILLGQGRRD